MVAVATPRVNVRVYIWKINVQKVFVQEVCIKVAPPPRLSLATLSSVNLLYLMR